MRKNEVTKSAAEEFAATKASWEEILRRAISTPGLIHQAYSRFHGYSLRNQLLAMVQCLDRGVSPGPLATYKQWEALGRYVRRGQRALVLCVPMTRTVTKAAEAAQEEAEEATGRICFSYRACWFVLDQTDGREYTPLVLSGWTEDRALESLGIARVPFAHPDGNVQGYATPQGALAISPVAALPHKTLFHEIAHLLLGHTRETSLSKAAREVEAEAVALLCCEALNLDGAAYARGYLQTWLHDMELTAVMAQRIIKAAHRILDAGRPG